MIKISGTTITMTRGDTFSRRIVPTYKYADGTTDDYEYEEGDVFTFYLRDKLDDNSPILIQKDIPADTLVLSLASEDTKALPNVKKTYYYDIEINRGNGTVIETFINKAKFNIVEEVG